MIRLIAVLKRHPALQFLTFFTFTCILFAAIFHFIDPAGVVAAFSHADPKYLSFALGIVLTYPTSIAWRWQYLLRTRGHDVPFGRCLKIVIGTWPIMSVTPLKSGDLLKGFYLRDMVPLPDAVGTVMTEKVLDLASLLALSIVGSLVLQQHDTLLLSSGTLLAILIGFIIMSQVRLPIKEERRARIALLFASLRTLTTSPRALLGMVAFSIVKWVFVVWQVELCFAAFASPVPFGYALSALPIAIFVGLLPVSISGMGTRDAALVYFFSRYASPAVCISVGILYAVFGYWLLSLVGLPFVRSGFIAAREDLRDQS